MTNHIDMKRTGATAPRGGWGEPFGANEERKEGSGIDFLMPFLPISEHFLAETQE